MLKKKYKIYIGLAFIVTILLIFRLFGIYKNLSFWNDENQVALMSRGILEYGKPITNIGIGNGIYQIGLYYLTALSFQIFGISEWAGRLPSLFAGIMLVIIGFYITQRIFNCKKALIVLFLLGFSQIQLAWATQLRPYIWLELFTLLVIYFLYKYLIETQKIIDRNLLISILVSGLSILFHGTGLINLIIISIVFLCKIIRLRQLRYLLITPLVGIISLFVILNSFTGGFDLVRRVLFQFYFEPLHYRIFLTHNYLWLIIGAITGFYTLFKRNRELAILLGGSIFLIFGIAIFKINPNYVRYSLPAIPLMYILFSEGVVSVIEKITKKEYSRWSLVALTLVLLALTGKFVFWPKYYYSINADMRENPIVDYKLAFSKINNLIKNKQDVIVMDAWNDRVPWYLPNQKYVFLIKDGAGQIDPVYGEKMLGTIQEFETEKSLYKSGIVIVEDWESLTPEDVKEHIRKNLKLEFTVQDLPYNENDHWGISIYSWGI